LAKPSDQFSDNADSPAKEGSHFRKVVMLDPGFREEAETSVLRPRILGIKPPSHPKDRRNVQFIALALIVSVLLFGILECKQLWESARDSKSPNKGLMDKR